MKELVSRFILLVLPRGELTGVELIDADLELAVLRSGWLLDLLTNGGFTLGDMLGVVSFLGLFLGIFICNKERRL